MESDENNLESTSSCAFSQPLILDETQENITILDESQQLDTTDKSKLGDDDSQKTQMEESQINTADEINDSQDLFDVEVIESSQNEDTIDDNKQFACRSPRKRKGSRSDSDYLEKPKKLIKSDSELTEIKEPSKLESSELKETSNDTSEISQPPLLSRQINLLPRITKEQPEFVSSVEVIEKKASPEIINIDSSESSAKSNVENSNDIKPNMFVLEDTAPLDLEPTSSLSAVPFSLNNNNNNNNNNNEFESEEYNSNIRDSFPKENVSNDAHSTPNGHNLIDEKESDSFKSVSIELNNSDKVSFLKKNIFYVEVFYSVNEHSKMVKKEISHINCEEIVIPTKRLSDISSGALADVSKNTSPSSSSSGMGLFSLPNRLSTVSNGSRTSTASRFSTSSTSSALSSASGIALKFREDHFLIPDIPRVKDKSPVKKLSPQQIEELKIHWSNSDQLFKILNAIDNSSTEIHVPEITTESRLSKTPEPCEPPKLDKIVEVNTPKSEKRSVRKKRALKSEEIHHDSSSNTLQSSSTRARKKLEDKETSSDAVSSTRNRKKSEESKDSSSDSSSTKSSARKKRTNSTNQRFHTPERDPPAMTSNLTTKREVFARWTDKKYYSGIIEEHVRDNKWAVKFDDGNRKLLIDEYIIPNCHTLLKGHSVYALDEKTGEYETGIVTKLWVEKEKICYEVELDNSQTMKVSADQLFLTEDQARTVREEGNPVMTPPVTPKRLGTVSLDNIVEGKRSTRGNRKYGDSVLSSPRPGSSGTRQLTPRKLDSEDDKSIESKSECCALEEIGGVEPELRTMSTPLKANKGPGKVKSTSRRLKRLPRYKDSATDEQLGPIPPDDSNIFDGLSFILVCAATPPDSSYKKDPVTSSETETDNEMMEFTKVPFVEERLKMQLVTGGGVVYSHFEEIPSGDYDICKLISNRPNRTAKYIQCVAAGIQILNHEWVVNCCKENRRLTFQELPVGWSIERLRFVNSFDRTSSKPLQNLLIYIAPNIDKQFSKFWERVCTLAGGTVIVMDSDEIDFQTATFVLADSECMDTIVDRAIGWGIPLLSTTWVVQSIIHGECRSFEAHSKYAYDSIEYD